MKFCLVLASVYRLKENFSKNKIAPEKKGPLLWEDFSFCHLSGDRMPVYSSDTYKCIFPYLNFLVTRLH